MTPARAFTVLGAAWAAMVGFELVFLVVSKVATPACYFAIFLRGVLAGAAFGIARLLRSGEADVPAKALAIGYALVAVVVAVAGSAMSIPRRSEGGSLLAMFDDTPPNVLLPEMRQAMYRPGASYAVVVAVVTLVVVSIACARQAAAQKDK